MNKAEIETSATSERPSRGRVLVLLFTLVAAVLLAVSLKFPLWQMRLEAPQYRGEEALRIAVHPNSLRGDIRELSVLNQYIGVHVPPTLPQFKWLPAAMIAGAILGVCAGLLPLAWRRGGLVAAALALTAALAVAALQAKSQMYQIGHHRERHTPLVGVQDFTPPFLGHSTIAQFQVRSSFGLGAWLIGAALALQFGAAWNSKGSDRSNGRARSPLRAASGTGRPFLPHPGTQGTARPTAVQQVR